MSSKHLELRGMLTMTLILNFLQQFTIRFKSGLLMGHSKMLILLQAKTNMLVKLKHKFKHKFYALYIGLKQ